MSREIASPRAALIFGALLIAVMSGCASTAGPVAASSPLELIDEVWSIVNEHFHDPNFNGVDWRAARADARIAAAAASPDETHAIIERMLAKLNTSHTSHYTPDDVAYYDLLDIFSGAFDEFVDTRFGDRGVRYEGIGVITRRINSRWHIIDVLPGSPAAECGLVVGDELLTVNGSPYEPVRSFRGSAGRHVPVTYQRSPSPDSRRTADVYVGWVYPQEVYRSSISWSTIRNIAGRGIGYVRIRSYASPAIHEAVVNALTGDGKLASAEALVVDLRGGWGGANPEYLDLFNSEVPALTIIRRDGVPLTLDRRWRKPIVLIIDGGTRSGKEVLAHAFQRHGIGPVVGERTAGAVVGGRPFLLRDESLLLVAVNDVLVDGVRLEGKGVDPDIEVKLSFPYLNGADPQLEAALRIAAERVVSER